MPRRVVRVIRNPKYYGNISTKGTDVALLELSIRSRTSRRCRSRRPPSTHLWDGVTAFANYDDGFAAGWGGIDTMGTPAAKLQWIGNPILKPYTDADTGIRMIPVNTSHVPGRQRQPADRARQRRRTPARAC